MCERGKRVAYGARTTSATHASATHARPRHRFGLSRTGGGFSRATHFLEHSEAAVAAQQKEEDRRIEEASWRCVYSRSGVLTSWWLMSSRLTMQHLDTYCCVLVHPPSADSRRRRHHTPGTRHPIPRRDPRLGVLHIGHHRPPESCVTLRLHLAQRGQRLRRPSRCGHPSSGSRGLHCLSIAHIGGMVYLATALLATFRWSSPKFPRPSGAARSIW